MDAYFIARLLLLAAVLGCLWMGRVAWLVARNETLVMRAIGSGLWCAAAMVIAYGLINP
jgi:hypothetical protein